MKSEIPIRRAVLQDARACSDIVTGWIAATSWLATPPARDAILQAFANAIPRGNIWVAGDPVSGYLSFAPDDALIRGFYTARPGGGTGKALLEHVKKGRGTLQLWTHAPNTRAHRFYLREGFVFTGKERMGDDSVPELHMEWHRDG